MSTKEDLQGFLATAYCGASSFHRKLEEENQEIERAGLSDYTINRVRLLLDEQIEELTKLLNQMTHAGFGHRLQH